MNQNYKKRSKLQRFIVRPRRHDLLLTQQVVNFRECIKPGDSVDEGRVDRRGTHKNSLANLKKTYTGLPSKSSMRNLQRCTDIFFYGRTRTYGINPITKKWSWMKAAFLTLTIPDVHTKIDGHKGYERLIKRMIQFLVYNFGVRDYIWKFEWQERGQGHWHIFVDRFCHHDQVRRHWRNCLIEEGLMKDWYSQNDYDPMVICHIQGMRDDDVLNSYLNGYLYKKSQNEDTSIGHLWGANTLLKKMQPMKLPVTEGFLSKVESLSSIGRVVVQDIEIPALDEFKQIVKNVDGSDKTFWVCSKIRPKLMKVHELLDEIQLGIRSEYISCYRRGDWEATHRLGEYFEHPDHMWFKKSNYEVESYDRVRFKDVCVPFVKCIATNVIKTVLEPMAIIPAGGISGVSPPA